MVRGLLRHRHTAPILGTVRIRRAVPADIPWLVSQLREFAALHPVGARIMGSDSHAEALLAHLMATQFLAVADADGTPVGLIAGAVAPHPFNPALTMATELWWWVQPPARHTRAGLALLNAYDEWADSVADLKGMTLEVASPVNPETLLRRGYHLAEYQYVAEVTR